MEGKESQAEECTRDGSLDRLGRPALRGKTGGWRSGMLLLGIYLTPTSYLLPLLFLLRLIIDPWRVAIPLR